MIGPVLLAFLALYILGVLFISLLQGWFIFVPARLAQDFTYTFTSRWEEFWLDTVEEGRINGLWFRTQESVARGVVLYFHGNSDNLARWGQYSELFLLAGYDVLMIDYRGFGKSTGRRSEANFYADAKALWEMAIQHYPQDKMVIYGRSMGSGVATQLASIVPTSQALILETPFYSMPDLFYAYYPIIPPVFIFKYNFRSDKYIRHYTKPVYIFHGTKDELVPFYCGERLFKQVTSPTKEFIAIEGGKHKNLDTFSFYREKMLAILASLG